MNRENVAMAMLTIVVFAFGVMAGFGYGVESQNCRAVVLADLKATQQYQAQLGQLVGQDFLTEISRGQK